MTKELIHEGANQIVAYQPFKAQLIELKKANEKTLFNYSDPKGNKEARSHIYKLRQSKAALEKVRKEEKATSLEYGRKVDAEAKFIADELEAMIEVHQKPLDEIEAKEQRRIDAIKKRISAINIFKECAGHDLAELRNAIIQIKGLVIDESFEEFELDARRAKEDALLAQENELPIAEKRQEEKIELERLRKETAEREQKERDDRIAKEAKEKAEAEAEYRIKAEREAAERRENELKLALEKAEKDKVQAIETERQRIENERINKEKEEEKRQLNKEHQRAINGEILSALMKLGIQEEDGKNLIISINRGEIPHVKITY